MFIQTQVLGPDTGPRKDGDPIDSVLQIKSSCLSEQDSGLFIALISIGINCPSTKKGFPGGSVVKNPPAMQETWVQSLGWEDPLGKGKATPLQGELRGISSTIWPGILVPVFFREILLLHGPLVKLIK